MRAPPFLEHGLKHTGRNICFSKGAATLPQNMELIVLIIDCGHSRVLTVKSKTDLTAARLRK